MVARPQEAGRDLIIRALNGDVITLGFEGGAPADLRVDGTFGLEWDGGYGQVGKILDQHTDSVVRQFKPLFGTPARGTPARLDSFAFPNDPSSLGLAFSEVVIATPLGPAPAWRVPAAGETWAILVHGKASSRKEALRLLPTIRDAGLTSLTITYRNDESAPSSPDGRYGYGYNEWEDIAAAMDYAQTQGARRFVLVGYSMGGSIIMALLEQPKYAGLVSGLVLDAPALDLKATVDMRGDQRGLPRPVTVLSEMIAARRYGIDWGRLDYMDGVSELKAPVLLFHSDADRVVPIKTSDDLAQKRPDLVTYARVPDVAHVRIWNADPAAYENAVRQFLRRVP
ncbi:MAG TPA: alpha/beta hydrolase [Dehalococcoidia bacterium]|nr:alpha/beta hydrolase [Dehalococcoidia bacterium]